MNSTEFSKRANGGKQIPAPPPHLAVNPARETRRLRVQANAAASHVQTFLAIGGAHTRRIQQGGFSPGQNYFSGTDRIPRQSQSCGQIVSSPRRQHPDGNICVPGHCVQKRLKRAVASKCENPLTSRGSLFPRDLREFRGTFRAAKFRAPLFFRSKRFQTRQSFAPKPAARCRVCQD